MVISHNPNEWYAHVPLKHVQVCTHRHIPVNVTDFSSSGKTVLPSTKSTEGHQESFR